MCFSSWSHEVSPMREESPSQRSIFKLDISASFSICMLNFRNNLSRYSVVYFGSLFIDVLILNDLVSIAHEATFSRLIKLSKLEFFLSWKTRWRRKRLKLTAILLFPLSVRIFFTWEKFQMIEIGTRYSSLHFLCRPAQRHEHNSARFVVPINSPCPHFVFSSVAIKKRRNTCWPCVWCHWPK